MKTHRPESIYQFKVTLKEIEPPIWRRIQVPAGYSFWDLHVAIQDALGWLDYHLHVFRVRPKHQRKLLEIGIPDEEWDDRIVLPGWEVSIGDYFTQPGINIAYEYDFGDGWEHEVLLEGILLKEDGVSYPRCIAGQRAGPPEDCGGVPGYYRLLEIIKNPDDEEYEETMAWLKGHAKNYYPYDPKQCHPETVHFDNPKKRWRLAFSQHAKK
jgi:hypothetical protein